MRVHISLAVRDLDAAVGYYERLFGQPATKRRPGYANFRLNEPPIHLALNAGDAAPGRAAVSHYGIELPDAGTFREWQARLRDAGVDGRDEPGAECCYAKADKVWSNDPDGNEWEVWVRTGEVERMGGREDGCCATSAAGCCAAAA